MRRHVQSDLAILADIDSAIASELDVAQASADRVIHQTVQDFLRARQIPRPLTVNFSGGIAQRCWAVTRGDGTYRVVYLPSAGYFALCVVSDFGLLDIGVHGPALGCFESV